MTGEPDLEEHLVRDCTVDDLLGLETLSEPRCAPDGSRVALVVTRRDDEEDRDRG